MSTAATLIKFFGQKVASLMRQLTGVQIVATPSRQFCKTNKLGPGFTLSFQIVSTLLTQLVRPPFYAQSTVAGVSFAFFIKSER